MTLTTDPNDPRLGYGADKEPVPQNEVYLVLSDEERAKGFIRPVRQSYVHVGAPGPKYPLRDLTDRERSLYDNAGYVKFETNLGNDNDSVGRYWTQPQLDNIGKGCGTTTTMGLAIAETYARNPRFYGATYCVHCQKHLPINEFVWAGTTIRMGE